MSRQSAPITRVGNPPSTALDPHISMNPTLSKLSAHFVLIVVALLVISWAATGVVRRYALSRAILDMPNHRSSHTIPTPRGGGAAIVFVFVGGLLSLHSIGLLDTPTALGIGGGAVLVSLIGWADDRRGVPALYRFLVQILAAVWAIWWLDGLPATTIGTKSLYLGFFGSALAVLGIVWCTNLFNFMDGIDGIAGAQAATAGVFSAALLIRGGNVGLGALSLVVAAASVGFLFWNWSPAKIFMGDVGSAMLGFVFAVIAVGGENSGALPLLVSLLLGGPFVVDATLTLLRRVQRGAKWYEPHRAHAYQRAVRFGLSHRQVSTITIAVNVVLGSLLVLTSSSPNYQLLVIVLGFVAVGTLYFCVERRLPMRVDDAPSASTSAAAARPVLPPPR
jgi:Fuc2NAc and GlcNAc transferase